MSTNDISTEAALLRVDDAVRAAYDALRAIGLEMTPARDAIVTQVAGIVDLAAYERDGVPLPVDHDHDEGGGPPVKAR